MARALAVAGELDAKLQLLRSEIERHALAGIRLRGQDWFAWATGGGSNALLLASETGLAEVLATPDRTVVLTDAIEAPRLRSEEVPSDLEVVEFEWMRPEAREAHVAQATGAGPIASDLPADGELALPASLVAARRRLLPAEIDRYRSLGRDAAEATTETLSRARPGMTEYEVAALGSAALLRRGMDPALVLVAGARRLPLHRHPRPTAEPIGGRVMVVVCARRAGLYANLTRFVSFREPTPDERAAAEVVARVEAVAWEASQPGATLGDVFEAIVDAYARLGHPGAERWHHQGGSTGYRSREVVATPGDPTLIVVPVALAWNPSLPGMKIEDTVVRSDDGLEVLTVDPAWPTIDVEGRARPDVMIVR